MTAEYVIANAIDRLTLAIVTAMLLDQGRRGTPEDEMHEAVILAQRLIREGDNEG